MSRKLISVVTPCFNEEANVTNHFERVRRAIEPFRDRYDFEHVYTDNCSSDRTFEILSGLGAKNPNVRAIRFSRNIGANRAIYLGLMEAKGDAVILIQADLQDPPELIPDFIAGWEAGFDVVYGQIISRREGFVMNLLRRVYYGLVASLADVTVPRNAGEFRLVSRRVLDAISRYTEDDLYLRGAVAHIGFPQKALPYNRHPRVAGRTSTNLLFLIGYALNGMISTSTVVPIRMVILIGLAASLIGFGYAAFIVIAKIFLPQLIPAGITTVLALITFFAGIQLLALGVIGEYIRKIYVQSLRRPLGFIKDKVNG